MMVSMELILQICAGFTCICVAFGWMLKIIKGLKKPADDVNEKLDNDNKRLKELEESYKYLISSNNLIIKTLFVILGELAVNNDADGKIKAAQNDINEFLINN